MTDILRLTEPVPTLPERLAAGRRAALAALSVSAVTMSGATPETYTGVPPLQINGMDIGPGIDAAVMETLLRAVPPPAPPPPPVQSPELVRELEWLLAEVKAGRVRSAAFAFVTQGASVSVGSGWHMKAEEKWDLSAAIDRLGHKWRQTTYV